MISSTSPSRICKILDVDDRFHVDIDSLRLALEDCIRLGIKHFIVVATLGTTVLGTIDPIAEMSTLIRSFKERENIEVFFHVDGASGGLIAPFSEPLRKNLKVEEWTEVSSLSIDWHKFGLVPYGAGSLICRKGLIQHISRQNKYGRLGHGNTLIGSRSGAMTVACWSVMKHLGREGFRDIVERCLNNAQLLKARLETLPGVTVLDSSDMHIVPVQLSPESPARRVFARHGIGSEQVAKDGTVCPQETFPLYVMQHIQSSDIHEFVDEIGREIRNFEYVEQEKAA
jgi:tyrosine decarboxylase/aspartate 1-decarboxylase